jgi:hypothetical protein
MSATKKYCLDFVYEDNSEIYSDDLELTDAEVEQLRPALQCLIDIGYVQSSDATNDIDSMLLPYSKPVFVTFDQLKENWDDGSLGLVLEKADFAWGADVKPIPGPAVL